MESAKKIFVFPDETIREVLRRIGDQGLQIALVVDADEKLIGVITDGDVRRAILAGRSLEDGVRHIMNRTPICVSSRATREDLVATFAEHRHILRIPAVDEAGRVVGIHLAEDLLPHSTAGVPVVLMAGGLGTRLRPHTDKLPKPMLDVCGRPILEHSIRAMRGFGFRKFYISVNYLREVVKDHFGNGEGFGVEIEYLEENERLGTAGALRLLPQDVGSPIIVMNGDILTHLNFRNLLDHFITGAADATMCLRPYVHQIPYGVASFDGEVLVGIQEKPQHFHFINAGIYVLGKHMLERIPPSGFFDMPSLFQEIMDDRELTATVFPIHEFWMDIGNPNDLEVARRKLQTPAG